MKLTPTALHQFRFIGVVAMLCLALGAHASDVFSPQVSRPAADIAADGRVERLEKRLDELSKRLEEEGSGEKGGIGRSYKLPPVPGARGSLAEALPDPQFKAQPEERVIGEINGQEVYVVDGFVKRRPISRKER